MLIFLGGSLGRIERYFEALKDTKIKGFLFEQQNYVPGDEEGGR